MIKAERDTEQNIVAIEVDGDKQQNEDELTAILINALDVFTVDDISEMLQTAKRYKDTGEPYTGQIC